MTDKERVIKGLELLHERLLDAAKQHVIATLDASMVADAIALLKEQMEKEQCLKTKCTICPHCDNCDVDENGRIKDSTDIVRCKDCKNWIPGYITGQDEFIAPKCGKYRQMVGHSSDDFCSLAERK